jgi:hypothetical protein
MLLQETVFRSDKAFMEPQGYMKRRLICMPCLDLQERLRYSLGQDHLVSYIVPLGTGAAVSSSAIVGRQLLCRLPSTPQRFVVILRLLMHA